MKPDVVDGTGAEESCNAPGANSAEAEKPGLTISPLNKTTRENTDQNAKGGIPTLRKRRRKMN